MASGANRALVASRSSQQAVSPLTGFDHGYEAYRPALIAFCERDCLTQKAENLRRGVSLDYIDKRMIDALKAAIAVAQGMRP